MGMEELLTAKVAKVAKNTAEWSGYRRGVVRFPNPCLSFALFAPFVVKQIRKKEHGLGWNRSLCGDQGVCATS